MQAARPRRGRSECDHVTRTLPAAEGEETMLARFRLTLTAAMIDLRR
jgi:hypothetical protein